MVEEKNNVVTILTNIQCADKKTTIWRLQTSRMDQDI